MSTDDRPPSGGLRAALATPLAAGGSRVEADAILCWDRDGVLLREAEACRPAPTTFREPVLLIPGLVDAHVHLPQHRVRGLFSEALLPWLQQHIWPEEQRFAEQAYRRAVTAEFRDGLIRAGTTAALVYGSPHGSSAHAVLRDLAPLRIKGGDVLMDRNGPDALLREPSAALSQCDEHAAEYGRRYVLTPRFVPTCSGELLAGCGRLLAAGEVRLQSHLSENLDELAWVKELHPELPSYTSVYAAAGLLGPRSIFGHGIHLDDEELGLLARSGSWIAHCPTSNIALGSGRMPLERLLAAGIPIALATDVGAGPELSMLHVLDCFLQVHEGFADPSPSQGLRLATLAGAQAMGEGGVLGTLEPGRQADVLALRLPGGWRRGDDTDSVLPRILRTFRGRWEQAVAGLWIGGRRLI